MSNQPKTNVIDILVKILLVLSPAILGIGMIIKENSNECTGAVGTCIEGTILGGALIGLSLVIFIVWFFVRTVCRYLFSGKKTEKQEDSPIC